MTDSYISKNCNPTPIDLSSGHHDGIIPKQLNIIMLRGFLIVMGLTLNSIVRRLATSMLCICGLIAVPVCMADRQAAASLYEEAAVYFKQGKNAEAVIQLKNALQQDAGLLSARILLGQVYLKQGNVGAAEKELREAEQLGADRSLTGGLIAETYLRQFKYQAILDELQLTDYPASISGELLTYHGHAYLELLQLDKAENAFKQAEALEPQSPAPLAGLALLHLRAGKLDVAEAEIGKALKLVPSDPDALNIQGSIMYARGLLDKALAAYSEVIRQDESHLEARLARAGIYIDKKQYQQAEVDLAYVQKHYKFEPRAIYMQSLIYQRRNEPELAKQALTKAAGIIASLDEGMLTRSSQLLMLAGRAYFGLGNYQQALLYLNKLRSRSPGNLEATKLLAEVLEAQGNNDEIIRVVLPLVESGVNDYKLLNMLGTAYMRNGRFESAKPLLEKAVELGGNDPGPRIQLALLLFATGKQGKAVSELTGIVQQDSAFTDAGAALAVMYIKQGRGKDAVKILTPLLERQPDNISLNNLLGSAEVLNKQYDAARATFEKIKALAPDFTLIQVNIARLDTIVGHYDDARARLNALLLKKDAPTVPLMLELAKTEKASGNLQEAIRWAEKARTKDRNALDVRQYLVDLYQQANQPSKALTVAVEAKLIAPEDLDVLEMVAGCYIVSNDNRSAASVLRDMTKLAGFDYQWLFRIARLQYTIKSYKEAEFSLQKIVLEVPDFVPANIALIEVLTGLNETDEAEEKLRALQARVTKVDDAERLQGDIYLKRGDMQKAIHHFQNALRQTPSEAVAIKLYQAYAFSDQWESAVKVMQDWLTNHPKDPQARKALAETRLHQGRLKLAAQAYEEVLVQTPEDSNALGNLAFIYLKLGKAEALGIAQKAYTLAPHDAAINDTLGWILVKSGNADQGLTYLREAHSRASNNPEIRYHIAVALAKLGRNDEALAEIAAAFEAGHSFEGSEDARQLKKQLEQRKP